MKFFPLACLFFFTVNISSQVYGQIIVTSTADSGPGTLREAITTANVAGGETILFTGIPNPSIIVIDNAIILTSNGNLIDGDIDGDGDPDVTIQSLSGNSTGLIVEGASNTLRKLHMDNFGGLGNSAIRIDGALAIGNFILGCYLGTDITGSGISAVAGNETGILVTTDASGNFIGDVTPGGRNIVSGNNSNGISISNSNNNTVQGNYIGLAVDGNTIISNLNKGIAIVGTATNNTIGGDNLAGEGNIISGNGSSGIDVIADANFIFGNYIGLDATGTQARGNVGVGVLINGDNNEIGDNIPGYGNVISANDIGIEQVGGSGTKIEGNIIGLDATGTAALGNLLEGINVVGSANNVSIGNGTLAGANYISGNLGSGVRIGSNGVVNNSIDFNFIGTALDGVTPIGNGGDGIFFAGNTDGNSVQNSVITGNGESGIQAGGGADQTFISLNSIYGNTLEGLTLAGLPLGPPTIDAIDGTGLLTGTADPGNTIEIFLDADDEGQIYLGSAIVDGAGNWSFPADLSNFQAGLLNINATQFDGFYTSEFSSAPLFIGATFPPFVVVNTDDAGVGSLRWAIGNANADPDINTIIFNIPSSDPGYNPLTERWTIAPLTNLEDITETVIIDATTQNPFPPASTAEYRVILDGTPNALDYGLQTIAANVEIYGFHFTGFNVNTSSAGISIISGASSTIIGDIGRGNIFNNNENGIYATFSDNHVIKGNIFGTDYAGTGAIPNTNGIHFASSSQLNTVGGPLPGEGNLISGNSSSGIIFDTGGNNTVENNLIGTDATGLLPLGNGDGIRFNTSDGNTIQGNVISGNSGNGILLSPANANIFFDNKIGVGIDGTTPLGNNRGIFGTGVSTTNVDNNTIGGTGANEPNIIAYNTNEGISITLAEMDNNSIIGNQIFSNGSKGIELGADGNNGKTTPFITTYGIGTVSGTGNDGDIIHVYRDNTGFTPLQGFEYLGTTTVAGGVWTVAEGTIVPSDLLNATATDAIGNTSEFAINFSEILVYQGPDNTGTQVFDAQPAIIDLGNSTQGTPINQIFTIENKSSATLTINSISITGGSYSILSAPATVAPNSFENFTLQLSGANAGIFTEILTIDSDDIDEALFTFSVTGEIFPDYPSIQADNIIFSGFTSSQVTINWTNGDGNNRVVIMKETTAVDTDPLDNTTYLANATFGSGDELGTGNFVVFNGAGSSVTVTGLTTGVTYHTRIYEYNGPPGAELFLLATGVANPASIILGPEITTYLGADNSGTEILSGQVTPIDFGSVAVGNNIDLTFAIENIGNTNLNLSGISSDGSAFSTIGVEPTLVTPGSTVNFQLRLDGSTGGSFSETITIINDDVDENTFTFPVTGIILGPEIEVFLGIDNTGVPITDGQLADVDFGNTPLGNNITQTFAIENTGSADLTITSITSGGPVFALSGPAPTTITAGSTVTFDIIMDGGSIGVYNEVITINNDDADENSFTFPVIGVVQGPEIDVFLGVDNTGISITDGQVTGIDFGTTALGNDIIQTFAIENTGNADLTISGIFSDGTSFSLVGAAPTVITPGSTSTFQIQLDASSGGVFNETISINSDDTDENPFTFPVTGSVDTPEIELFLGTDNSGTPITSGQVTAVDFGSASIGNSITLTFAIENIGGNTLNISSISSNGATFSTAGVVPSSVDPGGTVIFDIVMDGNFEGIKNEIITINNDDPTENTFIFPVTGITRAPEIEVYLGPDNTGFPIISNQATPIGFGSTLVGGDITQTFAIENIGNDPLTVSGITVAGGDFTVLNQPVLIPVGGTETFQVQLSGASEGVFSDIITIQNNDPTEAVYNFPVRGQIVKPEIQVFKGLDNTGTPIVDGVTTIEFGSNLIGNNIDVTFAIENIGSSELIISSISSDGTNFSLLSPVISPVFAGGTENFVVQLSGASAGTYTETITISNDDFDEGVFTFIVTGTITISAEPEIIIYQGSDNTGVPISNGQVNPVDIGQAVFGSTITQTFAIENLGTEVLNITNISIPGPEFTILTIPPNVVSGNIETFQVQFVGFTEGTYTELITIQNNDSDESTFEFTLTATIANPQIGLFQGSDNTGIPILQNLTTIEFGSVILGGDLDLTFAIENTGNADLIITDIVTGSKFTEVVPVTNPVSPGSIVTFVLRFDGSVLGTFSEQVRIVSNDPDEGSYAFTAKGSATCCPSAEISVFMGSADSGTPIVDDQLSEVNLGLTPAGTALTQIFSIRNIGTEILNIFGISVGGPEFSVSTIATSIPVGGTENFEIEFTGIDFGLFNDIVTINSDDADEAAFNFPVRGTIAAIASPEILVRIGSDITGVSLTDEQVNAVDIGVSPRNLDLDQTFTIENQGTIDLTVSSIDIDVSDFVVMTNTPIIVTPGSFENFTVRLSGQNPGIYSGNVTVVNNDLDEASFNFPIMGEILSETVGLVIKDGSTTAGTEIPNGQQEPINLGQTPHFQDIEKTFIIENTGGANIVITNISTDNIRYSIPILPGTISPGSFDNFTIRLDASIIGTFISTVTVTSNLGDYTFAVTGEVLDLGANPPLTVYNAVTPNGDGRHDFLKIESIESFPGNEFTLYTKAGKKIFEITDYNNSDSENRFEGYTNVNGRKLLANGIYYYVLNYTFSNGVRKRISGFIILGL